MENILKEKRLITDEKKQYSVMVDYNNELSSILYAAGINRITTCVHMSINYSSEPYDGVYALKRYVRKFNKRE